MSQVFRRSYSKLDKVTGQRVTRTVKKWYGEVVGSSGRRKQIPLSTDKACAEQILREHERRIARHEAGLEDPFAEAKRKLLTAHLADFRDALEARGSSKKHLQVQISRISRLLAECQFQFTADFSPDHMTKWLAAATRSGKSAKTRNYYVQSLKQFCGWLVRSGRLKADPFATTDRARVIGGASSRPRRAATANELSQLCDAAAVSKGSHFCLTGFERACLYVVAACTGLRASELASLRQCDIALTVINPHIRLSGSSFKTPHG